MGEERRQCKGKEDNAKAVPACPIVKLIPYSICLEVH